jgi:hypothetical protein
MARRGDVSEHEGHTGRMGIYGYDLVSKCYKPVSIELTYGMVTTKKYSNKTSKAAHAHAKQRRADNNNQKYN